MLKNVNIFLDKKDFWVIVHAKLILPSGSRVSPRLRLTRRILRGLTLLSEISPACEMCQKESRGLTLLEKVER